MDGPICGVTIMTEKIESQFHLFGTQKAYFQEDLFLQHLHRKFSWKNECFESIEEWKVAMMKLPTFRFRQC